MPLVEITQPNVFRAALQNTGNLILIDFHAPWCGPCRALGPTFADIANAYKNVLVIKADVDVLSGIAAEYDVTRLPTVVYVRNGREVDRVVGSDRGAIAEKVIIHSA